jgi:3-hydroxyisobutyrate dehydrogenase-like beta-hydroxyacid dehydrogenase
MAPNLAPTIGLIAQGAMGAGIGKRLTERGLKVSTVLEGRSAASAKRAADAGMVPSSLDDMARVDIFLSIVPPAEALPLASRLAPIIAASKTKPVYADLNAISPATMREIEAVLAPSGAIVSDGGILGQPPGPTGKGPSIFVSGPGAARVGELTKYGLDIRVMEAPIGAASAVKMSFAGINKGFTAMVSMMILAATRDGAADYLRGELAAIVPGLSMTLDENLPRMYDKAYRFAPEMKEIADYVASDPAAAEVYRAYAKFYERIGNDMKADKKEVALLQDFTSIKPLRAAE